jgi:hypothetical protein
MRLTNWIAALATSSLLAGPALAEEFDVSPAVSGNQIVTNAFQDALELQVENVRVFAYEFGEIPGQPFFLPDPGFHPLPGSGFAEGTQIGFNALSGVTYWDGTGSPAFGALPGGETMRFAFGSNSITVGSSVPAPPGFLIGAVDADGEFDDHLESFLERGGGLDPTGGIYLLSAEVTSDAAGVSSSPAIYWLFNNGLDEDLLNDARLYVRDTFAPGSNLPEVPEPSGAALAALLGSATLSCRRRRFT